MRSIGIVWRARRIARMGVVVAGVVLAGAAGSGAAEQVRPEPQPALDTDNPYTQALALSLTLRENAAIEQLLRSGQITRAYALLEKLREKQPSNSHWPYQLGRIAAMQNQPAQAFEQLRRAIQLGLANRGAIAADPVWEPWRRDPEWVALLEKIPEHLSNPLLQSGTEAAPVENGVAVIEPRYARYDVNRGVLQVTLGESAPVRSAPLAPMTGEDALAKKINAWYAKGEAAGNAGDFYDNRDRGHAVPHVARFPQLSRIHYGEQAVAAQLDNGLQAVWAYNRIVLGNSSTAVVNTPAWRSQPRLAYTNAMLLRALYWQFSSNQLYFYPEHRDHDPGHNGPDGYGDVFAANTPFVVIAQGSSGSEIKIMEAMFSSLAAMRPAVKKSLTEQAMIAPVLQMLLRMSMHGVREREDYLRGQAHPTVFDAAQLNADKMVLLAHDLQPDALPPMAALRLLQEQGFTPAVDYFDIYPEKIIETPAAMLWIYRSVQGKRRLTVSGASSRDPQGRTLRYHWVVLRGDRDTIHITPAAADASQVEIELPYPTRRRIPGNPAMESNRIDIALIVDNGVWYSAPAFICFYGLDNEYRQYDALGRVHVVDYAQAKTQKNYVDPVLYTPKDWRDEYEYDSQGKLAGWIRRRGGAQQRFDADGRMVTGNGASVPVRYFLTQSNPPRLDYGGDNAP